MRRRNITVAITVVIVIGAGFLWYRHATQLPEPPTHNAASLKHSVSTFHSSQSTSANELLAGATVPTVGATEIEVCGFGKVKLDKNNPNAVNSDIASKMKQAEIRWHASLLASDRYQARAVGLLLQAFDADSNHDTTRAEQARNDLAQLAVETNDPAVYAIAMRSCRTGIDSTATGECKLLSVKQWTQIDPDNAVPWLQLVNIAHTQHDAEIETDAFNHAAAAHTINTYGEQLYAYANAAIPADFSPLVHMTAATELIGVEAAWPRSDYSALLDHCSLTNTQDHSVRDACSSLAELYVDKGPSVLDFGIGVKVGERAGWSNSRVTALNQQFEALMEAQVKQFHDQQQILSQFDHALSCSIVQRYNEYFDRLARLGERGAAQEVLDQSGQTMADMAQKHVAAREEIKRTLLKQRASEADTANAAQTDK